MLQGQISIKINHQSDKDKKSAKANRIFLSCLSASGIIWVLSSDTTKRILWNSNCTIAKITIPSVTIELKKLKLNPNSSQPLKIVSAKILMNPNKIPHRKCKIKPSFYLFHILLKGIISIPKENIGSAKIN